MASRSRWTSPAETVALNAPPLSRTYTLSECEPIQVAAKMREAIATRADADTQAIVTAFVFRNDDSMVSKCLMMLSISASCFCLFPEYRLRGADGLDRLSDATEG